jgi:hypothetical protein
MLILVEIFLLWFVCDVKNDEWWGPLRIAKYVILIYFYFTFFLFYFYFNFIYFYLKNLYDSEWCRGPLIGWRMIVGFVMIWCVVNNFGDVEGVWWFGPDECVVSDVIWVWVSWYMFYDWWSMLCWCSLVNDVVDLDGVRWVGPDDCGNIRVVSFLFLMCSPLTMFCGGWSMMLLIWMGAPLKTTLLSVWGGIVLRKRRGGITRIRKYERCYYKACVEQK